MDKRLFFFESFLFEIGFPAYSLILTILVYCRLIFSPVTSREADMIWRGVSVFHPK